MSPSSLIPSDPAHAVLDVAEIAAVSYYAKKLSDGDIDPVKSQGRIVPTVNTRGAAEYAVVAGAHIAIANFLTPLFCKFLLFPWWAFSFGLGVVIPAVLLCPGQNPPVPPGVGIPIVCILALLWVYFIFWRWGIKAIFRWLFKRGPAINPIRSDG